MLTTRYILDEAHLKYYDEKLKSWASFQPVKTIPSTLYPWALTDKAGAVSLWPVGGTPLKPVVDFLFAETPPAEGDKGPSNPSTITGVSSVNVGRIGKNQLLKISSFNWAGLDVSANADGSYTFNGTATLSAFSARAFTDSAATYGGAKSSVHLDRTKNYTLSCELVSGSVSLSDPDGTKPGFVYGYADTNAASVGVPLPLSVGKNSIFSQAKVNDAGEFIVRVQMFQTATFTNAVYRFQLEEGSTATDFEAPMLPADANHVLPLGSTYYGGTLDAASGVMTVTWTAVRLGDFQNSLQYNSADNRWEIFVTPKANYSINAICTHSIFKYGSEFTDATDGVFRWAAGNLGQWLWFKSPAATAEAFLAIYGNAYVAFALAAPYTVQLSPTEILSLTQPDKYTPRLNTVYTDASSVQVGYVKSPIREEYELKQAIVAQGGNI